MWTRCFELENLSLGGMKTIVWDERLGVSHGQRTFMSE